MRRRSKLLFYYQTTATFASLTILEQLAYVTHVGYRDIPDRRIELQARGASSTKFNKDIINV